LRAFLFASISFVFILLLVFAGKKFATFVRANEDVVNLGVIGAVV